MTHPVFIVSKLTRVLAEVYDTCRIRMVNLPSSADACDSLFAFLCTFIHKEEERTTRSIVREPNSHQNPFISKVAPGKAVFYYVREKNYVCASEPLYT